MGDSYLFVVGINQYKDSKLPQLNNAVRDAKAVRDLLVDKYQFSGDLLVECYDRDATKRGIVSQIKKLVSQLTEKDNLLIYFAGHGEFDETFDTGYWLPYDAVAGQVETYIDFDFIVRVLRVLKARHTFLITDSCYAGSIFANNRNANDRTLERLEQIKSRWLLTAGRKEPVPDGRPGDHSPFAQAVIEMLSTNTSPRFGVAEFCSLVLKAASFNADAIPRGEPLQNVGHMGGQFMFRLKGHAHTIFEEPIPKKGSSTVNRNAEIPPTVPTEDADTKEAEQPMRTVADARSRLRALVTDSDFEKAFELFNRLVATDSRRYNDIIMQQSQYNGIKRQMRNGLVDNSFGNMTLNRIRYALNSIIDEITERDLAAGMLEV